VIEISYAVSLADAHAHLLRVTTTIRTGGGALPSPLTLFMPVWTPGSYLVREYARHVEGLVASSDGGPVTVRKVRKNAWRVDHGGVSRIDVDYNVYANELTVRTNHVDATHAYWNGAATYLALEGARSLGARIVTTLPAGWGVATSLAEEDAGASTLRSLQAGDAASAARERVFVAKDIDELCDAPFECGKLIERSFSALGRLHRIVASDNAHARAVDWEKLEADTRTIVETEARLIAGSRSPEDALPYQRYLFLWFVTLRDRGGLEHKECATLMAKPTSFQSRSGYLDVLSLIAHEYFHLWNVKRIRPMGLTPYRYEEENYTRLLWWFEGATSYYDWRTLRLAKLCTASEYLNHLAEELARLQDTPGALVRSLEESSFDAWIKAYRPDENSLNSTVSYYLKGEIICAFFDLTLRHRTEGRVCLDDVVRHLYWELGERGAPIPEDGLPSIFARIAGVSLDDCFASWVAGTDSLDVNAVLGLAGLAFERSERREGPPASIGARLRLEGGRTIVEAVVRGGAAHRAGLDVKDELLAIADRRLADGRLDLPLHGLAPGQEVFVLYARDGWVRTTQLTLEPPLLPEAKIIARADAPEPARRLYESWLAEPFPAQPPPSERAPSPT
jgi:predicted metalloprotease with PDZ domain